VVAGLAVVVGEEVGLIFHRTDSGNSQ